MQDLIQLLINNVGSIATAGGFIWYLTKRDKIMQEKDKDHNIIITNHLSHSNQIIKDDSSAKIVLATELQKLCDIIKSKQ